MNSSAEIQTKTKSFIPYLILLGLLTFFTFLQVKNFGFVNFDDPKYVSENARLTAGLSAENIRWALTTTYFSNWHPVTWIAYLTIHQFFGLNPAAYHLANLFFHLLNVLLLFGLLARLTGATARSLVVAAFFAVHPLRIESVAWISQLKDCLSVFFWLLAAHAYLRYVQKPGIAKYTVCLALFSLGLMSKPMVITLPFVLLLLDYWPLGRINSARSAGILIAEKIPFFILSAAAGYIAYQAQLAGGALAAGGSMPFNFRLTNTVILYVKYIFKMIAPVNLAIYYPKTSIIPMWQVFISPAILLTMITLVLQFAKKRPYLPVGWFWYMITMLPIIGIIPLGAMEMADRYTYLPSIGFFIMIIWLAADACSKFKIPAALSGALALAVIALLTTATLRQLPNWKDSVSLFSRATDATSYNYLARVQLGNAFLDEGKFREAKIHLEEAVKIGPKDWHGHDSLGIALTGLNEFEAANERYSEALRLAPEQHRATIYFNFGVLQSKRRHIEEAEASFKKAIELNPEFLEAYDRLGALYAQNCRIVKAQGLINELTAANPNHPGARIMAAYLEGFPGDTAEEKEDYCELFDTLETLNKIPNIPKLQDLPPKIPKLPKFPKTTRARRTTY